MEKNAKNQESVVNQDVEQSEIKAIAEKIVSLFVTINKSTFVAVRQYLNSAEELANHILIANIDYPHAVRRSVNILKVLTDQHFTEMEKMFEVCNESGIKYSENKKGIEYLQTGKLPKEGTKAREQVLNSVKVTMSLAEYRDYLIERFENNLNSKTKSKQSIAQVEAYEPIYYKGKRVPSMKINRKSKKVHIWAFAHSKQILKQGTYKPKDLGIEAKQKWAIEKYCKEILGMELPTTKFRTLIVEAEQMASVKTKGKEVVLAE